MQCAPRPIYTHGQTHIRTHPDTQKHTHTHIHTHAIIHMHTRMHAYTRKHTPNQTKEAWASQKLNGGPAQKAELKKKYGYQRVKK